MAFSEDVMGGSSVRLAVPSAGDGGKEEEKPGRVSWDAELRHARAAPTLKVLQINWVSQNSLSPVLN